jgi:ADP-ribose pyrophosphatase YjhB (NUDIX family)
VADDRLIVAALLRTAGQVLLVAQQGPGERQPEWTIPTGVAAPGELLLECLQRAVREETGLEVVRVGELILVSQSHLPPEHASSCELPAQSGDRATAFVFEVTEWTGQLPAPHPDGVGREARFWSRREAIDHLEGLSSRVMSEPIVAYLRDAKVDDLWLYRHDVEGNDNLVWPVQEPSPESNEQLRRARAFVALGCIVILAILIIIVIIGLITLARPFA